MPPLPCPRRARWAQRGYGERRVDQALRQAGIGEDDGARAREAWRRASAVAAALRFAQRRRIGPFATSAPDPQAPRAGAAAMIRAGHGFDLARRLVDLAPDPEVDADALARIAIVDAG